MKFINIRGCNGSGKTTLLRELAWGETLDDTVYLKVPHTVKNKHTGQLQEEMHKPIPITLTKSGIALVGDYFSDKGTVAGCDKIKTQIAAKNVLNELSKMNLKVVLFEGILISTIYYPWAIWSRSRQEQGDEVLWAFLNTPLEVCSQRIQERNGGKPINEQMLKDKYIGINHIVPKARKDGLQVTVLNWQDSLNDLKKHLGDLK